MATSPDGFEDTINVAALKADILRALENDPSQVILILMTMTMTMTMTIPIPLIAPWCYIRL